MRVGIFNKFVVPNNVSPYTLSGPRIPARDAVAPTHCVLSVEGIQGTAPSVSASLAARFEILVPTTRGNVEDGLGTSQFGLWVPVTKTANPDIVLQDWPATIAQNTDSFTTPETSIATIDSGFFFRVVVVQTWTVAGAYSGGAAGGTPNGFIIDLQCEVKYQ